jgi:hypothetical protein
MRDISPLFWLLFFAKGATPVNPVGLFVFLVFQRFLTLEKWVVLLLLFLFWGLREVGSAEAGKGGFGGLGNVGLGLGSLLFWFECEEAEGALPEELFECFVRGLFVFSGLFRKW